jgi:hypothetical protein
VLWEQKAFTGERKAIALEIDKDPFFQKERDDLLATVKCPK